MSLSALDKFYINTYGPSGLNILTHYYPANESSGNMLDAIGSLNGVLTGGNVTQGNASILPTSDGETCYHANTGSTYVLFSAAMFTAFPVSIEAWVQCTNWSTGGGGLATWISVGGSSDGIKCSYLSSLTWLGMFNNVGTHAAVATLTPTNGATYHMVQTTDGTAGGTKIYLNGVLQTVATSTTPSVPTTAQSLILCGGTSTNAFGGYGEKWAIYNTALTQAQITANYNAGNMGPPPAGGAESPGLGGNMNAFVTGGFQG